MSKPKPTADKLALLEVQARNKILLLSNRRNNKTLSSQKKFIIQITEKAKLNPETTPEIGSKKTM